MAIINLTKETFKQQISEVDKPVIVDFWAPWCTYCRRIAPAFDKIASQQEDKLIFAKLDIDDAAEIAEEYGVDTIPTLIIFKNGEVFGSIVAPDSKAKIEAFIEEKIYDVVIIGGGPGGYTSALYCARAGLSTMVLEKLSAGGQMALTSQIDNYPGFEEGIDGFSLAEKMEQGAERFGAETELAEVLSVDFSNDIKIVESSEGTFKAKTVIIATGAVPRELGVPGEKELVGRGVGYCATCDGMFYRNKTVMVVGGGNTAAADAMTLSRICEKVILVHRRDSLRATKVYHKQLEETENIEFYWNTTVSEFLYEKKLTGAKLHNVKTGEDTEISVDGAFISIGRKPASELFEGILDMDEAGYIVADESTRTNIPGVFAIGDVRTKALRQVVTAVADGATASHYIEEYLAHQI